MAGIGINFGPQFINTFNQQVKILIDKEYPEAAGMAKERFLVYVNSLKDEFEFGDFIVIPERMVSICKQMLMIELEGKRGFASLALAELRQAKSVETPNVPYLIRGVKKEFVIEKRGWPVSLNKYVRQIKEQRRFGLVTEEGIAIARYYPVTLIDYSIYCLGSRYLRDSVPTLRLSEGQPFLDSHSLDDGFERDGFTSCGIRIQS